jgi:hypothetical protein
MDDLYIREEDYGIPAGYPLETLPEGMTNKLRKACDFLKSPFEIPVDKYSTIYTTSDIHSDLIAISKLLYKTGLTTGDIDTMNVFDIRWNPLAKNTLLVITGDIVDGKRQTSSIVDRIGDIEILVHIFLYNLRLSAREYGSELRFTIGNHDYYTIFTFNRVFLNFIHDEALAFFGGYANRARCLIDFYMCCPYVCVTVGSDEIIFVHASYHSYKGEILNSMIEVQREIDAANYEDIYDIFIKNVIKIDEALEVRSYAYEKPDVVCNKLIPMSQYKLIVVGHCQTHNCNVLGGNLHFLMQEDTYQKYGCNDGGCVVVGCNDEAGPHLAFVDIAMSGAFRNRKKNKSKRYEILKLDMGTRPNGNSRYCNKITRINVSDNEAEEIPVWEAIPAPEPSRVEEVNTDCKGGLCTISGGKRIQTKKLKRSKREKKKTLKK